MEIGNMTVKRFIRWMSISFIIVVAISFAAVILGLGGLIYLRSQPLPPYQIQETTMLYDIHGNILDVVHQGQNRLYVSIDEVPLSLLQAFVAIEDQRFFQHQGIDFRRLAGAILVNLKTQSKAEGASTITQQLARNLYLNHDKTWQRKIKEAIYTLQLEMNYSKTHILERYINQIYFGHSTYGVQAASRLFFNKQIEQLTLAESALLAGIPKGPLFYSPWLNEANAFGRQALILRLMQEQGYITEGELQRALEEEVIINDPDSYRLQQAAVAPYFRDYVKRLAIQRYGIDEQLFDRGGLRIITTLDADMQRIAEEKAASIMPEDRPLQIALMAMDPRSGHIKAFIGGKDYAVSQFNRIFAERQPGSSIKPLLYYAALEHGFTPITLMKSEPTTFIYDEGRAEYSPRNFNDRYPHDYITLEQAIARSDNIYAVKTLMFLGEQTLVNTLHRFGLSRSFSALPSLALGAQNISLFEMVQAYGVLAYEGARTAPVAILRIEDREGKVLVSTERESTQVLDQAYTFILNRMLRSVFEPGGTGHRLQHILQRPVAGKTGSTDTDAWMLGYTPQLVTGVWVGYDQGTLINHNNDGRLAGEIWAHFMEEALVDQMPALFPIPPGVIGTYINPESGLLASIHCPVKRLLFFKEGTEPTQYCHEHVPDPDMAPVPDQLESPPTFWDKMRDWWRNSGR
jgi:1A family penicillin-binding protein